MDSFNPCRGELVFTHKIGLHVVREYVVGPTRENAGNVEFHTCGGSFDSLDKAILASICNKAGEAEALKYVTKLLGLK